MSRPGPDDTPAGLYTIAPGAQFLDELAAGIVSRFHRPDDPLSLANVTVFLPTRRAARTLAEALMAATGAEALVMPAIHVLGDVDEDEGLIDPEADLAVSEQAIGRLERELILAAKVDAHRKALESPGGFAVSLALARSLARLIDDAANEDADLSGIAGLAPGDLAQHWDATVDFLKLATVEWPKDLKARSRMDPAERRSRLIRAYAMALVEQQPDKPFVVAGSSGSVKATADLMKAIAGLPNGAVVLNGLDEAMDDDSWEKLPPSHPQFALKELLIHLGVDRSAVGRWAGGEAIVEPRAVFLSEAMRPPETADQWAGKALAAADEIRDGVAGFSLIEAANEREEALAVALAMRETLETPDATVALVTADRMLARRVSAELKRWGIEADDSAGMPLAKTEAGALPALALEAAIWDGAPVELLSLLKHPRVFLSRSRDALMSLTRRLERRVLRRGRVGGGFDDARDTVMETREDGAFAHVQDEAERAAMLRLLDDVQAALGPLIALREGRHGLTVLAAAHAEVLENLSLDDRSAAVWRGSDGEAAYQLMHELATAEAASGLSMSLADYAVAFDSAARSAAVRPQGLRHPRVSIWGPLEARMQSADLMILGGLNEGVWPANPADDPWLSRPMRAAVGLSQPERRIGLAAHDFATLAAQPRVLLTRAKRKDGAPASPSRFLLRMTTLAEGAGAQIALSPLAALARQMDASVKASPAPRPMPRPPVAARPRLLSVTRIETWVRDPYAIYAEHVLKLKPLERLMQARDARDRGNMIHLAVELFAARNSPDADAYETLVACGEEAFGAAIHDPDVRAFWWPRFLRAARWLAEVETRWAATRAGSVIEERHTHHFADVDFTLSGKPDRIDRMTSGGIRVIDYKTGGLPTVKQVEAFMAPQLPLLAAMARAGAFGEAFRGPPEELIYAQLGGGKVDGKVMSLGDPVALADALEARLKERVRQFDDEAMPYAPRVAVKTMRTVGDYDHLSRMDEWGDTGEAGA